MDIFDNTILCNKCNSKMEKVQIAKNGFSFRAVQCPKCGERIIHPNDAQEYKQFNQLKRKVFKVKLRLVGNSYAVSIPRPIVDFMQEQEREMHKRMSEMVNLCFEDMGRISLMFHESKKKAGSFRDEGNKASSFRDEGNLEEN